MKIRLISFILICFLSSSLLAQHSSTAEPSGSSPEEILIKQASTRQEQPSSASEINKRMLAAPRLAKVDQEYLLGPGDKIELTVEGIPGLDKKEFTLDAQGGIFIPYLGQVDILGLSVREVEAKLIRMFAVSLLEDPQVTVGIKEYRSQYFYVMGSVPKPGKYSLIQSTDILDALAQAGGLTDKADPKIKIYRYSQERGAQNSASDADSAKSGTATASTPAPFSPIEVSISRLLDGEQSIDRVEILSGDVITVQERKERSYYVLGDILKPGAYSMPSEKGIAASQALANAGGMLKTASGKNMMIVRRKANEPLPEQIKVDAYALLEGKIQDIELHDNDIVLVPGSASKTLAKAFLSGISGVMTTLLVLAVP